MARSTPFRLNRSGLLLALISAAFAGQAGATAGRVEFALGGATVVGTDGRARSVARGTEVDTGDLVRTNNGRVQLRMTDGSFISLQPNTEFGIKNYKFEGKTDGSESAFFSLLKGAMRTVTGLVGRFNRNRYQVSTPTATVGIRGTGGLIQVLNDGSTLVQGTSGIWFLANPAGSIDIPAGVSGIAPADPKQPPRETADIPTSGPAPLPALQGYVQGEQREPDGTSVITPPTTAVLQSGSGYTAALAYGFCPDTCVPAATVLTDNAVFNGAGQLIEFGQSARAGSLYRLEAGGSHAEFGTDGILAWGRWIGPVANPDSFGGVENYNADQGLHYVVGLPTPSMPQSGSATYTLIGATQPTYIDGSASPGTFSGSLNVDFGKFTVGMNLSVVMPDAAGPKGYEIGASAPASAAISGSTFSGFFSGLQVTGTGGACVSGCTASVNGFFAGTSAERAGLGYHINDFLASRDVVGAAAFTKQ